MAQYSRKSWKDTLNKFVLKYRFTPPKITQCVPSYIIFLYKFNTDILAFQENQQKSHRKTLNELDKQQKEKSKQSTDSKRKYTFQKMALCWPNIFILKTKFPLTTNPIYTLPQKCIRKVQESKVTRESMYEEKC